MRLQIIRVTPTQQSSQSASLWYFAKVNLSSKEASLIKVAQELSQIFRFSLAEPSRAVYVFLSELLLILFKSGNALLSLSHRQWGFRLLVVTTTVIFSLFIQQQIKWTRRYNIRVWVSGKKYTIQYKSTAIRQAIFLPRLTFSLFISSRTLEDFS